MAKKRKDPPKSATLLDFFSNTAPAKKGKLNTPAVGIRRKENLKVAPSQPRDIIVIGSDSEDEASSDTRKGKLKVSGGMPTKKPMKDNGASIARDAKALSVRAEQVESQSTSKTYEGPITFGKPSGLLLGAASSTKSELSRQSPCRATAVEYDAVGSSMFGAAGCLLLSSGPPAVPNSPQGQDKEVIAEQLRCSADNSNITHLSSVVGIDEGQPASPDCVMDMSSIEDAVEEWGLGDDELAVLQSLDEDVVMEYVEEQSVKSPDGESAACPICERDLSFMHFMDAQNHVNMCIDQTASSSSAGVNSTTSVSSTVTREQYSSKEEQPEQSEESLYSVLMTSHKENEAWKEAAAMEDRNFRPTRAEGSRRKAPFYKVLQGMPIAVDAFRYGTIPGVTAYFLTHAHSDHYTNLASNWKSGPIYCSEDTANLVIHMLAVDPKWVHPLPMDVPTTIPNTGGVIVTLIEANHCPGSCLFFFEGQQTIHAGDSSFKSTFVGSSKTFRYLHCGDFRASPRHVLHPAVKGKYIDHVYLDTTYLDPKYTFPPQPLVISACAELARRIVAGEAIGPGDCNGKRMLTMDAWVTAQSKTEVNKEEQPSQRILVVIGTYSIGKERIVKAVAQALKTKIYCDARKAAILRCQTDPELHSLLTSDPIEGGVHLLPLGMITSDKIKPYVERFKGTYSRAVAFRPTGWTYTPPSGSEQSPPIASIISRGQACSFSHTDLKPMQKSSYTIQMFGVPYSEHSSFFELTCFAMSCDWGKMIATVNVGSESSRAKMAKWVARWEAEKKRNKDSVVKYREIDYW